MNLGAVHEQLSVKDFYGKVIVCSEKDGHCYIIRFTSVPPEVVSYFLAHQEYAPDSWSNEREKRISLKWPLTFDSDNILYVVFSQSSIKRNDTAMIVDFWKPEIFKYSKCNLHFL